MSANPQPASPGPVNNPFLRLQREYQMTQLVLSVLVERLLEFTDGEALEVTDDAMRTTTGVRAWRDESRNAVLITKA